MLHNHGYCEKEEKKRIRRVSSIRNELAHKSREAALAAVQIFNNPQIQFKSELFIVTMNIAWTYLLHAHFRIKECRVSLFQTGPAKTNL